ncbi:MAG: tripartite tricarboxylate transporter TctB family protein [Pseudorhodobacter sp.]
MNGQRSVTGLLLPLMMIGFAVSYWIANRHVPQQDMRMVIPLTVALILLSLAQIWRWFAGRDHAAERLDWAALKRPLLLLLSTLILLFGADHDFPIAAALFLALSLPVLGMRRPLVVAGVAILFPLAVYGAFTLLGVPLNSFWLGG